MLATSHKVTKTKFLIKPKQLDQRLGQLISQKSDLWLIICQSLVFTDYSHNSVLVVFFFFWEGGGGGAMAPPWPYVGPSLHIRVIWVSNGLYLMCHARCFHVWIFVRTKPNQPRPVSLLTSSASLPRPRISRRFTEVSVNLLL